MDCIRDCILNPTTLLWMLVGAVLGAVAGALIAFVVVFIVTCLGAGGALVVAGVIVAGPAAGVVIPTMFIPQVLLACAGVSILMSPAVIVVGAIIGSIIGALAALAAVAAYCAFTCQGNANGINAAAPGTDAAALVNAAGATTCQQAQDLLAEAQRQLNRAIAARDAQQREVDRLRRRRNQISAGIAAALAAAAASLPWNPIAAAAFLLAAAAGAIALVAAQAALVAAQVVLAAAQAAIGSLQAAVDAAKALVDKLCPPARVPPAPPPPPPGGVPPVQPGLVGT